MPVVVRVLADWECWPTWTLGHDGDLDNVEPASLGLSSTLVGELLAWSAEHEATFNQDDPGASGFNDRQIEEEWEQQGLVLAARVAAELGSTVAVEFRYRGRTTLMSPDI